MRLNAHNIFIMGAFRNICFYFMSRTDSSNIWKRLKTQVVNPLGEVFLILIR